ncbi:MAG: cytochrome c oxidase subunit 3 [Pseudomonadota bacterium]|jgi:cytochrome c oxidase subunit 3|nr:cytochrome c oxidase subunit 3 [Pseudomonadota bacterium]
MTDAHADSSKYYVPHGSPWPIIAALSLFSLMLGAVLYLDGVAPVWILLPGVALLAFMFAGWFSTVIGENQHGVFHFREDRSFRLGMMWFIFSEVMFFAAFFGALFYTRNFSVPWLGGEGAKAMTNFLLWPHYEATWPTNGPGHVGGRVFSAMSPTGVAAINTLVLLTSGLTITIAHHALRAGKRRMLTVFLALTFLLGFTFVGLQAHEYYDAYMHMNLRLTTGIYGSTFFMLTGFHGLHVTIGAIMLLVIWVRVLRGHFTPERHFAFEAVAWYWHFVDVVWLCLFVFVYWL